MQRLITHDLATSKRRDSSSRGVKRKRTKHEDNQPTLVSSKIQNSNSQKLDYTTITSTETGWINVNNVNDSPKPLIKTPTSKLKKVQTPSPSSSTTLVTSPVKPLNYSSPLNQLSPRKASLSTPLSPTERKSRPTSPIRSPLKPLSPITSPHNALKSPSKRTPITSPVKSPFDQFKSPKKTPTCSPQKLPKSPSYTIFKSATSSPASSPRKSLTIPHIGNDGKVQVVTSSSEHVPAYKKHKHLVPTSLKLPEEYQALLSLYETLHRIVAFNTNRGDPFVYHRNKFDVEKIAKRQFTLEHLKQIVHLVPEKFDLAPSVVRVDGKNVQSCRLKLKADGRSETEDQRHLMFVNRMLQVLHASHEQFLRERGWDIKYDSSKLREWHPKFPLNDVKIPLATLPTDIARPIASGTNTPDPKREQLYEAFVRSNSPKPESPRSPSPMTGDNKSRAASLLERIRVKEQEKVGSKLFGDGQEARRKLMLSRLPDIVKAIHVLFSVNHKKAMPVSELAEAVNAGLISPISLQDTVNYIHELAKICSNWAEIETVVRKDVFKIRPGVDIGVALKKLSEIRSSMTQ